MGRGGGALRTTGSYPGGLRFPEGRLLLAGGVGLTLAFVLVLVLGGADRAAGVVWLTLGLSLALLSLWLDEGWAAPLGAYSLAWGVDLFLNQLHLVEMEPLDGRSVLFILLAWAGICTGALLLGRAKRLDPPRLPGKTLRTMEITLLCLAGVSLLGYGYWLYRVNQVVGLQKAIIDPVFLDYVIHYGPLQRLGPLGRLYATKALLLPLAAVLVAWAPKAKARHYLWFLLCIIPHINVRRGSLFLGLIWSATAYIYARRARGLPLFSKRLIPFGVAGSLVLPLFAVSQVYLSKSFVFTWQMQERYETKLPPWMVDMYLYACATPSTLPQYLARGVNETPVYVTWVPWRVLWTIYPGAFEEPSASTLWDFSGVYIPFWWNVAPYIRQIYGDFGPFGVFVIPLIMGFCATLLYRGIRAGPNPARVLFAGYAGYILVVSVITFEPMKYDFYWNLSLMAGLAVLFRVAVRR